MQRMTFLFGLIAAVALMAGGCEKSRDEGMKPEAQKPVEGAGEQLESGAKDVEQGARDNGEGAERQPMGGETGDTEGAAGGVEDTEQIGVAECDDYYEKHLECINNNVPAAEREQLLSDLNEQRDTWKQLQSQGADNARLKDECKRAHEEAKENAKQYGCEL